VVGFRGYCPVDNRFEKVGAYCDCSISSGRYRGVFTGGRYHVLEMPRVLIKVRLSAGSGLHLLAPMNTTLNDPQTFSHRTLLGFSRSTELLLHTKHNSRLYLPAHPHLPPIYDARSHPASIAFEQRVEKDYAQECPPVPPLPFSSSDTPSDSTAIPSAMLDSDSSHA